VFDRTYGRALIDEPHRSHCSSHAGELADRAMGAAVPKRRVSSYRWALESLVLLAPVGK